MLEHCWRPTKPLHASLRSARSLMFALLVSLPGCAVGPNYERPMVDSPAVFRFDTIESSESLADMAWWELYTDETLQELIRIALVNNYDVRIAVTNVEQARQFVAQAKSQYFPAINYSAGVSRGRNEFLGTPNPNNGTTSDPTVAVLSAAWEMDVWGRIRRLNESALAEYLATEEAKRGVMLSLVSDVATAYFVLLELDLELIIAQNTAISFAESLQIFEDRLVGGIASNLETSRAAGALGTTEARIPELQRFIAIQENVLSLLLGSNPGPIVRTRTLLDQTMPPDVPAGLPSSLLERRPDIRQAEQLLRSANAQVGVAQANFFPQLGLTAMFGKVSPELSAFSSGSSNAWSIGANLAGPIFQGGALKAQFAQAKAFWEQSVLEYQKSALNAFAEVSNALISRDKFNESEIYLVKSVAAYQESVKVSMQRYLAGKASYFEVLQAQQELFPTENALALTQLNQRLAVVQLYKALGGGWQLDDTAFMDQPQAEETPATEPASN